MNESAEKALRKASEGKSFVQIADLEVQESIARTRARELKERTPDSEDAQAAEILAQAAEKRIEVFTREHDSAGAWKGERLGRDLARDMRDRSWERNDEGQLAISPEDERTHLVLIHMGELDRLNASGDHTLGDHGLRLTNERIEFVVREVLGQEPSFKDERRLAETYDIYRHAGNDFALNLRNVDPGLAEEIRRRVSQTPVDVSQFRPGEEPVPVAASRVTRADGIALMNALDEKPEDVGLTDQKVLITAMLDKLQTLNDISKVEMRTRRIVGKLREGEKIGTGEAAAKELYDKFLRKSLGDVFKEEGAVASLDYEGFRRLMTDTRALELPPSTEWTHLVAERAMNDALNGLKARRAVGRSIEISMARKIAEEVLGKKESFGIQIEAEERPPSTPDFTAPEPTTGKRKLSELQVRAEEVAAGKEAGPRAAAMAELAQVDYDLEKAKRDERTGLLNRGSFFERMENAFAENKPVSIVAIDMAFLKYFDKEGGPATGNLAIAKATEALDNAAKGFRDRGVDVEAYRVGGDEFALTIVGADEATLNDLLRALRSGERSAGRVPATAGAQARYRSEGLQFNYGVRTAPNPEAFRAELEAAGIPLKEQGATRAQNELADYLFRLADKEVEIQKGVNRMVMLMNRALEAKETGEVGNLDVIKAYSQKAIFGEAGEKKIDALVARLEAASDRQAETGKIRGEILEFVIEQIDKKNEAIAGFEASLDRRLEDAVRIRYFEARISELEGEIEALHAQLAHEKESREALQSAVAAAEEEKRAIVSLRERLQTGPPSSSRPSALRPAA